MKTLLNLFCFFLVLKSFAQNELSAADWQSDLKFLQNNIHRDYSHLFKKVTAEDFDNAVKELYDAIPNLEDHEVRVGLSRIVSLFKYGHTQIPYGTVAKSGILPINLYQFKDDIYIEGVHKHHKDALGAKVIKIGETPIHKALKLIYPVVPVENEQYFKAYGLRFLITPEVLHAQGVIPELTNSVTLTLEKDGQTFTHAFKTIPTKDKPKVFNFTLPTETWLTVRQTDSPPLFLKHFKDKSYYFEYLEDSKTLYVRQSSVFSDKEESLPEFYERLFKFIDTNPIDKLIYDVRLNGGGNNYNNLPLIKGLMARPKVNTRGKFFYIIGRETFSACQNLTNEITRYTDAILVGEPTAENVNFYGDARSLRLPKSRLNVYLSYAWWQDAPQWENKDYSIPNIAVETSFEEYIANQDPVLNAALNYTETGFILDPMQHLTNLFMKGDIEQLKKDAIKIGRSSEYKYYDFEKEFNDAAQRLLGSGDPTAQQSGLYILQLITEVYPESQSSWYSLGNALENAKAIDKAKNVYQKLISINQNSMLARAAKNRLKQLKD